VFTWIFGKIPIPPVHQQGNLAGTFLHKLGQMDGSEHISPGWNAAKQAILLAKLIRHLFRVLVPDYDLPIHDFLFKDIFNQETHLRHAKPAQNVYLQIYCSGTQTTKDNS
jgi:hypothetical protein